MAAEHTLAFVLFAVVAAITPGPSNLILTSTGASVGVLRGLPSLFGVTVGMGVMMFLVAFGLGSAVLASPAIILVLKWCGVGFLLWLAWKIASAGRGDATASQRQVGFWQAAAFQWVNPKSWLVCASAAGTYLEAQAGGALPQSLTLGALFVLAALPSCFVWLAFGATLQRLLRSERASRIFNLAMGGLLAGSILLFIW
ncbi:MAG TPA: LysE family translocator [Kouleothrix sp.]|uniref:LysE family translocator n=1 Tax=Kouleothrix sp. TaxID=2779161 RepID=UPI002BA7873D|nr:LysE family translocator [Kouleothrix sp.]